MWSIQSTLTKNKSTYYFIAGLPLSNAEYIKWQFFKVYCQFSKVNGKFPFTAPNDLIYKSSNTRKFWQIF